MLYTTSCKHSLVLLKMGEIIARNLLSWLKLLIKLLLLRLVGCLYYCISDVRSHKHQTEFPYYIPTGRLKTVDKLFHAIHRDAWNFAFSERISNCELSRLFISMATSTGCRRQSVGYSLWKENLRRPSRSYQLSGLQHVVTAAEFTYSRPRLNNISSYLN